MSLKNKIERIKAISVEAVVDNAILATSDDILNANRNQMYERGVVDIKNPTKKEKYATSTIRQKRRTAKFPNTDFITLKWDGDFHDSLKLLMFKDKIVIQSDDLKWANWLESRFNALGLTEDSLSPIRDKIRNEVIKNIRNELR